MTIHIALIARPLRRAIVMLCAAAALLTACQEAVDDARQADSLPRIYPDYIDVTIPAGIAPLNFNGLEGRHALQKMDVTVTGSNGGELHCQGDYAHFDIDEWHQLTEANRGATLTVTVSEKRNGQWTRFKPFAIHVSADPLGDWGLTYRRVMPGYEVYSRMGIYQRDLSSYDETPLITNDRMDGQCVNCHTSNRTNPDQYAFHVRGTHGATYMHHDGTDEALQATNDTLGGSMVYPYWHPDGQLCAFSTNKTRQSFYLAHSRRLEVFDQSSDLLVYDARRHTIHTSPLLSDSTWMENTPAFSPDGRWLYFITAPSPTAHPELGPFPRYSLCRIAFDARSMTFGEKVDTLVSARKTGKSVTWPRPSYDGRHLMFTLIDRGYFSVWHDEAEQWMLDLATLEAHPLTAANSRRSDSFHNWSTNSRWVVFTSRRADGLHSQLFIAHIDANGRASKPFLLPQEHPWHYYDTMLQSFNTPDFALRPADIDGRRAERMILGSKRTPTMMAR